MERVNEIFAKKMLHIVFARKGMRDLEGISILGCTLSFTQDRRLAYTVKNIKRGSTSKLHLLKAFFISHNQMKIAFRAAFMSGIYADCNRHSEHIFI